MARDLGRGEIYVRRSNVSTHAQWLPYSKFRFHQSLLVYTLSLPQALAEWSKRNHRIDALPNIHLCNSTGSCAGKVDGSWVLDKTSFYHKKWRVSWCRICVVVEWTSQHQNVIYLTLLYDLLLLPHLVIISPLIFVFTTRLDKLTLSTFDYIVSQRSLVVLLLENYIMTCSHKYTFIRNLTHWLLSFLLQVELWYCSVRDFYPR